MSSTPSADVVSGLDTAIGQAQTPQTQAGYINRFARADVLICEGAGCHAAQSDSVPIDHTVQCLIGRIERCAGRAVISLVCRGHRRTAELSIEHTHAKIKSGSLTSERLWRQIATLRV